MPKFINKAEIKESIKEEYVTLVNFSRKFDIEYSDLISTLNGKLIYQKTIDKIKKAGYEPIIEYKYPRNRNQPSNPSFKVEDLEIEFEDSSNDSYPIWFERSKA